MNTAKLDERLTAMADKEIDASGEKLGAMLFGHTEADRRP